ncbi:MAG: hypothetical protein UR69_C0002G0137 [Candidatus Moranbacteria bacterium GW2011_GWE2_35_2-]|nr:MAG: hypothetical protein UR69_C0002G0137 [Candidatus Moranbacteria bacterium GW2011_GWE2_35_2-]KKQ04296.1 MAG: hypothetical protein US15_C0061G0003 [Candidatus Moranbacteria bacterium GW2011_GWF1_36_4]KKQ22513.1 MAG: hypothetical protein US37_C0002G0138 [Candidatus Moranbacteria bacterium GW2011_GWF2_37_11]KKQ29582.1 MAG: hypothetical protein US44_C0001G0174 [Candidatus Moranbacteria bacterium GW2011_GWD1_37_17]KKQ30547.1 MAG: hypothetical protein US47_C0002G0137 [Candidatus Moranbacteria b
MKNSVYITVIAVFFLRDFDRMHFFCYNNSVGVIYRSILTKYVETVGELSITTSP